MRSCDEIVELISASLDGELTADEQTVLDEHIAFCPACSALLDDLRALHTAASGWEEVAAPADFTRRVMDAVAAESTRETKDNVIPFPSRKAKSSYWKKWTVSAAAIAIVVLGAVSAPSLMGNFSRKDAVAESADMAYARNDSSPSEALMDVAEDQAVYYVTDADSAIKAESKTEASPSAPSPSVAPESPASEPAPDTKGEFTPGYDPAEDTLENAIQAYVGKLILEGMLPALESCEGAVSSDGTVTYLVSADLFTEILKELEASKPVGYSYLAGTPDAQLGKIVVQSN